MRMTTFWKIILTAIVVNVCFFLFATMLYLLGVRIHYWEAVKIMLIFVNGCGLIATLICICIFKIWGDV